MKDERQILQDAFTEAERNFIEASLLVEREDWAAAGRALLVAAAYCREANQSAVRLRAAEREEEQR
jgi:hypothetical protein